MPERPSTQDILAAVRGNQTASPARPPRERPAAPPETRPDPAPGSGSMGLQEKLAAIRAGRPAAPPADKPATQTEVKATPRVTPKPAAATSPEPPVTHRPTPWLVLGLALAAAAGLMTLAMAALAPFVLPQLLR